MNVWCILAEEELQKSQKRYKKHYEKKAKPRCLEVGDQVLILLLTDSYKLLMQWRGQYIVESRAGANAYRMGMGSKTKIYHLNMLRQNIAKDDAITAVARVIYQETHAELGEVPDLEDYHQKEGDWDIKLGDNLSEDQ